MTPTIEQLRRPYPCLVSDEVRALWLFNRGRVSTGIPSWSSGGGRR